MKGKLSTRLIKTLKPTVKPFEVMDTELKGFLLRIQPSGRKTYYYAYRTSEGSKKRIKIGVHNSELTVAQARDIAIRHAADVAIGQDVQKEKQIKRQEAIEAKGNTLLAFMEAHYRNWALSNLKSGDANVTTVQQSFPDYLQLALHDITPNKVEKWRTAALERGLKPSTVNRRVNSLKAILTKAVEWEVLQDHPLRRLKDLKVDDRSKVRFLSSEEETRLLESLEYRDKELIEARSRANEHRKVRGYSLLPDLSEYEYGDHLTPMIILSLKTGVRRGELFDLCWEEVDFNHKVITILGENAKSSITRHIPLSPTAFKTLSLWRRQAVVQIGRVFPCHEGGRLDNVNTSWRNLLKHAQIESFRWHDMRHDFASKLVMKGIPLNTVRELCGHADLNTTLRYAHLCPDHKADAVAALG